MLLSSCYLLFTEHHASLCYNVYGVMLYSSRRFVVLCHVLYTYCTSLYTLYIYGFLPFISRTCVCVVKLCFTIHKMFRYTLICYTYVYIYIHTHMYIGFWGVLYESLYYMFYYFSDAELVHESFRAVYSRRCISFFVWCSA